MRISWHVVEKFLIVSMLYVVDPSNKVLRRFTLQAWAAREQRRSVAYAEREQRAPIVLSYWQRLSRAAEPRLVG